MQHLNVNGQMLEVRLIHWNKGNEGNGSNEGHEDRARAAPLVFLHEGLGSVSAWTQRGGDWPLALCQATGRAGIVYSRQGYGQSCPATHGRHQVPADYLHTQAWMVLPALLDQLGAAEPILVGHSDGASIALLYASRHPTAACIAMAPHVMVEAIALAAIAEAKVAYESGALKSALAKHHADVHGAFWQWNDVWLSPGFRSFDIREQCRHITAPLLLIQGLDDAYGTMAQLDETALAAPHAQQLRLRDCGHSPHRDQPQVTLNAITSFLDEQLKPQS